jgi:hypothetical protein
MPSPLGSGWIFRVFLAIIEFRRENTLNLLGGSGCFWYKVALKKSLPWGCWAENLCGVNSLLAVAGVIQNFPESGGGKITLDWQTSRFWVDIFAGHDAAKYLTATGWIPIKA